MVNGVLAACSLAGPGACPVGSDAVQTWILGWNLDPFECHTIYPGDLGPNTLSTLRTLRDAPRKQR